MSTPEDLAGLTPEQEEAVLGVMVAKAEDATWAGVSLSAADWSEASDIERAAWVKAGRRVAAIRAAWAGRAAQGSRGTLEVLAEIDGGEAHDENLLAATVLGVAQAMVGRRG